MSSIGELAAAYGMPESEIEQRIYALAEQIHQNFCLQRGLVQHSESRPDQDVAVNVLRGLWAGEWALMKRPNTDPIVDVAVPPPFVHFGDDSVMGWAEPTDDTTNS